MNDTVKFIVDNFVVVITPIILPVMIYFAVRFIKYLETKFNFELSTEKKDQILDIISQGICYADEQDRKAKKTGGPGAKLTQEEKMRLSSEFVRDEFKRTGITSMASDVMIKLIEAELNGLRE